MQIQLIPQGPINEVYLLGDNCLFQINDRALISAKLSCLSYVDIIEIDLYCTWNVLGMYLESNYSSMGATSPWRSGLRCLSDVGRTEIDLYCTWYST